MPTLIVLPSTVSIAPGQVARFRVSEPATAPESVHWSVAGPEGADAGVIDAQGKYTASASIHARVEATISARSGGAEGTATVTVAPPSSAPADTAFDVTPKTAPSPLPANTVSIEPASAVLSPKAAQRFEARDTAGQPVSATWSLLGTGGLAADVVGTIDAATGAYTAPAEITVERNIIVKAVTASGATDKAFVALTPGTVRLVPSEVTLRATEQQRFSALVLGDATNEVEWLTSPGTGVLGSVSSSPAAILYTAPSKVGEDAKVVVTAISTKTKMVGYANVTLLADPWTGFGPSAVGIWLLLLAMIAPLLYWHWPPPLDRVKLAAAIAARDEAARAVQQRQDAVTRLAATLEELKTKASADRGSPANPALEQERRTQTESTQASLTAANESLRDAQRDSQAKANAANAEQQAREDNVRDERLLFVLVLLAGGLGSFVHTSRSFVDFLGNRRLRPSWTWWYVLQPFTGAALAMVMYLVIRGGFFASTTGAAALNPWGFVAVAAMVGLFSKQATNKLDELFSTMFRTDKERELKDKLQPTK
jgi:hypothetical protein